MQNLKDLMRESIGVDNWSTDSTWNTRGKDENEFKKLALGLCSRDFDKVKDSIQKFADELQKNNDVTQVSRRPGYSRRVNLSLEQILLMIAYVYILNLIGEHYW